MIHVLLHKHAWWWMLPSNGNSNRLDQEDTENGSDISALKKKAGQVTLVLSAIWWVDILNLTKYQWQWIWLADMTCDMHDT